MKTRVAAATKKESKSVQYLRVPKAWRGCLEAVAGKGVGEGAAHAHADA